MLHTALDDLTDGKATCHKYHCDSFLLGELIKTLHKTQAVWPRPAKPFVGISHAGIVAAVNGSVQLQWRAGKAEREEGVDLWGVKVNGTTTGEKVNRKRKTPAQQPITPESSPEPVSRSVSSFETHQCDARKLVGGLDKLDGLEDVIVGLELESSLGYRLY